MKKMSRLPIPDYNSVLIKLYLEFLSSIFLRAIFLIINTVVNYVVNYTVI
jgi:hypothetical protein